MHSAVGGYSKACCIRRAGENGGDLEESDDDADAAVTVRDCQAMQMLPMFVRTTAPKSMQRNPLIAMMKALRLQVSLLVIVVFVVGDRRW